MAINNHVEVETQISLLKWLIQIIKAGLDTPSKLSIHTVSMDEDYHKIINMFDLCVLINGKRWVPTLKIK